jgi:hypothetical protein
VTLENERKESDAPAQEEARQGEAHGPPRGERGRLRRAGLRPGRMKWVYVGVFGVIALGIALKFAYPLRCAHFDPFGRVHERDAAVEPEDYEPLNPFFVPMPSGRDKVAATVRIRVKWDRLTGARFKRDSVLIRQRIYLYLRALEKWSEDMEANRQVLEEGIARILRQALGVKDLDVLVEELRYVHVADSPRKDDQTPNAKEVCAWMHSPMSATDDWGSSPAIRWWG